MNLLSLPNGSQALMVHRGDSFVLGNPWSTSATSDMGPLIDNMKFVGCFHGSCSQIEVNKANSNDIIFET